MSIYNFYSFVEYNDVSRTATSPSFLRHCPKYVDKHTFHENNMKTDKYKSFFLMGPGLKLTDVFLYFK